MKLKDRGFILVFCVMLVPEMLCDQSNSHKKLEKLLQMFEGNENSRVLEKLVNSIEHNVLQYETKEKEMGREDTTSLLTFEDLIELVSLGLEIFFHYDVEHTLKEIKETIEEVGEQIVKASERHNESHEAQEHASYDIYPSESSTIEPYLYIQTDFPVGPHTTDTPIQPHSHTVSPSTVQQYMYTYAVPNMFTQK